MQCPICNAAVWMGQRYCATCDNYLPHPEEKDYFCPRCGIRVAPQQGFCHKCKATLPEMAGTPSRAPARAWRLAPRVLSIFIGIGLVAVALLLVFPWKKSQEPPQLMVTSAPQAASEPTPAAIPIPHTAETTPSAPTAPAAQEPEPDIPSAPASPSPPEVTMSAPSPPMYFVNIPGLALREGPTMSAPQIATLYFKDEVELLETSGGWGRVRDVQRNIVGWSYLRHLQPVATEGSRAFPRHRPPDLQGAGTR
jgi:hypothetical protein